MIVARFGGVGPHVARARPSLRRIVQRKSHGIFCPCCQALTGTNLVAPKSKFVLTPFNSMSTTTSTTAQEDPNDFDNEFLEDVMEALPKGWSEEQLLKQNYEWSRQGPESDWVENPPLIEHYRKKKHVATRTSFPSQKVLLRQKYQNIVKKSTFMLVFSHYMNVTEFAMWRENLLKSSDTIEVHGYFKNALYRSILKDDENLSSMHNLFRDQIGFVSGIDSSTTVQDIAKAMKSKGDLMWMGGMVQNQVVDHTQMEMLSKSESEDAIRGQIIGILMGAPRNLVRVIKNPLDNLVKVMNFKAGPPAEEAEGEGDSTQEGEGDSSKAEA